MEGPHWPGERDAPPAALPAPRPTSWRATFDRIGRSHDVAPLTVASEDPETIAQAIYNYAGRFLSSREVSVGVDLEARTGRIFAGFRTVSEFTLEEVSSDE